MTLSEKFERFCYKLNYGPFMPEPAVQDKLESLGYEFNRVVVAIHTACAVSNEVTAPNGEPVSGGIFRSNETLDKYYQDYDDAVAECGSLKPK